MARTELERVVQQSVLDRLMDADTAPAEDAPDAPARSPRARSIAQLKASLRRDLEWLLNTRRNASGVGEHRDELRRSVYRYGLPDISAMSRDSAKDRTRLLHQIEETIALFEPRLAGVRVSLVDSGLEITQRVHFLIEGMLRMDPAPERVVFDTVLEVGNGEYRVERDRHA